MRMSVPATPKVSADRASSSGRSYAQVSRGENVNGAMADPSPASTYGGTAVGDSVPATPVDPRGYSITADGVVIRGDVLRSAASSPGGNAGDRGASPQGVSGIAMGLTKNGGGAIKRENVTLEDPFIQGGGFSTKELVKKRGSNGGSVRTSPVGSGKASTSPIGSATATSPESATSFRPREDRATQAISSDNAQAVLPPHACVFIANLCNTLTDEDLALDVHRKFSRFGTVYIKIRRDTRGMPFAFAQYETVEAADRAIRDGRGLEINGRACRTERAKVNRSLYLHAIDGHAISEAEAREILHGCGDLEKLWHSSETDMQIYHLPEGIWVTFAFFQDARDAQVSFRDNDDYHLDQYDQSVKPRVMPFHASATIGYVTPGSANRDRNTNVVYLTNLPVDTSPELIDGLLWAAGWPVGIEIRARNPRAVNPETYAIVEYRTAEEARRTENHAATRPYKLGNRTVTVKARRVGRNDGASGHSFGSPSNRRGAGGDRGGRGRDDPGKQQLFMERAIKAGVPPHVVHGIFDESPRQNAAGAGGGEQWAIPTMPFHSYGVPLNGANVQGGGGYYYDYAPYYALYSPPNGGYPQVAPGGDATPTAVSTTPAAGASDGRH